MKLLFNISLELGWLAFALWIIWRRGVKPQRDALKRERKERAEIMARIVRKM